jgi:predicted DNA-binding transcriptional regulator AlpA
MNDTEHWTMKANDDKPLLEQYLTTNDIIAALRWPDRTLRRHIAAGTFPKPDTRLGTRLRWKRSTVEQFLSEAAKRVAC